MKATTREKARRKDKMKGKPTKPRLGRGGEKGRIKAKKRNMVKGKGQQGLALIKEKRHGEN